ncbi:cytosolic 5'-nucleotidase 1A isoform X3 [Electrophorus electricus]|uniref:Uncharacterized protein n=1 Tax=Electrophorus electricus TaxID=8005 RepID=A0A4W4H4B7_ELEEL|nr:cytosolic 5'-nucleotidase 1A isoform X3 [Electrophorus electricus]
MDPKVTSAQIEKDGSALVMAVSCHGMFDLDSCNVQPDSCALPKGAAFAFIKAVQTVNQRLLGLSEKNKTLLFEVVLLGKDCEEHIKLNIFDSAKHYGVPAALLYQQAEQQAINRLKVLFSGDLIGLSADSMVCLKDRGFTDVHIQNFKAAKECLREFVVRIGEMKRMFGHEGSPLHTSLMTVWGSRDVCASALKTLRGWGLDVDEAFCLAGATCGPILALLQPHIVWDNGLHNLKGVAPLLSS